MIGYISSILAYAILITDLIWAITQKEIDLRESFFLYLQEFFNSVVHILDALYFRQTQAPPVADIEHTNICSSRFRVFTMNSTRLKRKEAID